MELTIASSGKRVDSHEKEQLMAIAYGAFAGAVGTAVSHPWDTTSVFKLRGDPLPWKNPLAFYRGIGPAVSKYSLAAKVFIFCCRCCKVL